MDLAIKHSPPPSQLNPRDVADYIDLLVRERINARTFEKFDKPDKVKECEEAIEVIKRELTDYFLAADRRAGLYFKGPHDDLH